MSSKAFFGQDITLSSNWKGFANTRSEENCIKCYVNKNLAASGFGWMPRNEVYKGQRSIDIYKIYIPEAGGNGHDAMVLGRPFIGEPESVCSLTYIVIGYDPDLHNFTKVECENILSYIKTKFVRFIISLKKKTQHGDKEVYQFVPLQDWSKPWTDEELYAKYDLSKEEIDYIEAKIKLMD